MQKMSECAAAKLRENAQNAVDVTDSFLLYQGVPWRARGAIPFQLLFRKPDP
jgi:hypothetical protein